MINSEFRLEIKPEIGEITPVSRIIPAKIDTVMNLRVSLNELCCFFFP